jgi:uncharacterized membrane protein
MGLAAVFVGLGIIFLVAPRLGALVFGVPAPEGEALVYLPVIGLRDLAFGLYLAALAMLASRRTVGIVLGLTVLIPVGDMILLALTRGLAPQLALHLLSGLAVGGVALWLLTRRDNDKREDIA